MVVLWIVLFISIAYLSTLSDPQTILYHIIPYIISYQPYHTIPYQFISYLTIPYDIIYTISYHTISYHTKPYHIIPYHTIPYHTISCYTISHHIYTKSCTRYFADLAGFFLSEDNILASGNELMSRPEVCVHVRDYTITTIHTIP